MMSLDRCNAEDTLIIYPTLSQFRCASMWLTEQAKSFGLPDEGVYKLDICLTETLTSILEHGGKETEYHPITLQIHNHQHLNKRKTVIEIIVAGVEFVPFSTTAAPCLNRLEDATLRGLGLAMLRQFSDHQSYRYHEACNHLSYTVFW